jgi:AcrR family transcriptional regulator
MTSLQTIDTKKPYHHGDLRDAILIRAAEIIGDQGIEALSLRAIARDLGVSHGAPNRHFQSKAELLSALGATAWYEARTATLNKAEALDTDNPHIRLNAMGRGYLEWALNNPALFSVLLHPDVARYANDALREAQQKFEQIIYSVVVETQAHGRYPDIDPQELSLYTTSVPYGIAALLRNPLTKGRTDAAGQKQLIADLIELVVPIKQFNVELSTVEHPSDKVANALEI